MFWEAVLKQIRTYDGFQVDGKQEIITPSKKVFEWKGKRESSIQELLGEAFWFYFQEMDQWLSDEHIGKKYSETVQASFKAVRKELEYLIQWAEQIHKKRVNKRLVKIDQDLDQLQYALKGDILSVFRSMEKKHQECQGYLGEKGAQHRLMIRLYNILHSYTNLTIQDKTQHIAKLFYHFKLVTREDHESENVPERVRQAVIGRSKKEKDKMRRSRSWDGREMRLTGKINIEMIKLVETFKIKYKEVCVPLKILP